MESEEEVILLSLLSLFHVLALSPALAPSPAVVRDVSPSPSLWTESDYFCGGTQEKENDGTCTEASVCAGYVTCCFSSSFLVNVLGLYLLASLFLSLFPSLGLGAGAASLSCLHASGSGNVEDLRVVVLEIVTETVMVTGPVCSGSPPPGLWVETRAFFHSSCSSLGSRGPKASP